MKDISPGDPLLLSLAANFGLLFTSSPWAAPLKAKKDWRLRSRFSLYSHGSRAGGSLLCLSRTPGTKPRSSWPPGKVGGTGVSRPVGTRPSRYLLLGGLKEAPVPLQRRPAPHSQAEVGERRLLIGGSFDLLKDEPRWTYLRVLKEKQWV